MKIAISTNSGDPDRQFSSRFGRCKLFLITDSDGASWQELDNPAAGDSSGAGSRVVQLLADQGVESVISGRYGPNACQALQAAGMDAYLATGGTPRELAASLQEGQLDVASGPSAGRRQGGRGRAGRW